MWKNKKISLLGLPGSLWKVYDCPVIVKLAEHGIVCLYLCNIWINLTFKKTPYKK